jgi:ligand-binding SRPBCC domain-containing protein
MRVRTLTTELWLPRPVAEVFGFFGNAWNLDALTPPWLHFRILTPQDAVMRAGALVEYNLRWRGIPLNWLTEISTWEPPHRFVDRQLRGPYRQWVHEHTFEERDSGTLVRDRVDYAIPGGIVEPLLHRLIVGGDVRKIFDFRQQKLRERFGGSIVEV